MPAPSYLSLPGRKVAAPKWTQPCHDQESSSSWRHRACSPGGVRVQQSGCADRSVLTGIGGWEPGSDTGSELVFHIPAVKETRDESILCASYSTRTFCSVFIEIAIVWWGEISAYTVYLHLLLRATDTVRRFLPCNHASCKTMANKKNYTMPQKNKPYLG